jgi:hypothetical protein
MKKDAITAGARKNSQIVESKGNANGWSSQKTFYRRMDFDSILETGFPRRLLLTNVSAAWKRVLQYCFGIASTSRTQFPTGQTIESVARFTEYLLVTDLSPVRNP